jgi:protein gp37
MSLSSKIEWTESTWNPVTGCSKVSPGCANCYAEAMAKRLKAMGNPSYFNGFEVTCHERMLELPLSWNKPRVVFVNSMSDLFHEEIPLEFVQQVFSTMREAEQHTFQVLTKRSERLVELADDIEWPENVWMGVSIENSDYIYRLDHLREVSAAVKFISFEPLLGPVGDAGLTGVDWVVVGGESGPKSREIKEEWVLDIKAQCEKDAALFFFKQWGGANKKKAGRLLLGRTWDEMPLTANLVSAK